MQRLETEGWSKGLAYRFARDLAGDDYNVCVLCGWAWPGPNNRCVNPNCKGFCTWGEKKDALPTSWMPNGPRPVGVTNKDWQKAWIEYKL